MKRLLNAFLGFLAVLIFTWETIVYRPAQSLLSRLSQWPGFRQLERWITRRSTFTSVLLFMIPVATLFPFKLAGLYLMAHHHPLLGSVVFLTAKWVGAALFVRLFVLVEPALRRWSWLDKLLTLFFTRKEQLMQWYFKTFIYQRLHSWRLLIKERLTFFSIRFFAWFKSRDRY